MPRWNLIYFKAWFCGVFSVCFGVLAKGQEIMRCLCVEFPGVWGLQDGAVV